MIVGLWFFHITLLPGGRDHEFRFAELISLIVGLGPPIGTTAIIAELTLRSLYMTGVRYSTLKRSMRADGYNSFESLLNRYGGAILPLERLSVEVADDSTLYWMAN
jgi:hypothetical protein